MKKREKGDLQKSRSPSEKRPIATHLNLEARAEPREYARDRSKHISCRKRNESATSGPRGLTTNDREEKRSGGKGAGVQECGVQQTGLGSICVCQRRRAKYDGVLVAKLCKSLLGQTFTAREEN